MEILIRAEEEGLSPLEVLQRRLPAAPLSYLRQLIKGGKVGRRQGDGMVALCAGESLHLPDSARLKQLLINAIEPEILYESREILAVFKPAGLAVHRGVGHESDNLTARVEKLMRHRGTPFRTAPVHRLDAATSGPVIFAKGRRAAAALGNLFMAGEVEKVYLGLARGTLPPQGRLQGEVPAKGKSKEALTDYRTVVSSEGLSLLELTLHSGRKHQIRRQLADAGHPLAGDLRYRGPALPGLERLFLHCCRLALKDPFSGILLQLDSALTEDLQTILRRFNLFYSPRRP